MFFYLLFPLLILLSTRPLAIAFVLLLSGVLAMLLWPPFAVAGNTHFFSTFFRSRDSSIFSSAFFCIAFTRGSVSFRRGGRLSFSCRRSDCFPAS
jgi:peptidoglycan/LPS O-acetylase OafA/YrhL